MKVASIIFCFATAVVVLFQLGLAAGMPWGERAMGGRHPGRFPPTLRIGAVVQALLLAGLALVVLVRARVIDSSYFETSRWAIWLVVGISALSTVLNSITPSKKERVWAPVGAMLLATSLTIALS